MLPIERDFLGRNPGRKRHNASDRVFSSGGSRSRFVCLAQFGALHIKGACSWIEQNLMLD